MTVNKFGNYLNITTQQHILTVPPVVHSIKEPVFKRVSIENVKGNIKEGTSFYTLEHNKKLYELKMKGEIQNIDISADSILTSINKEYPISAKVLVRRSVNMDDISQILRDLVQPLLKDILVEIIILCSLIEDE